MLLLTLIRASLPLQVIAVALLALGAWKANNLIRYELGRSAGKTEVISTITQKADDNAKTADAVRDAVAAGKRGLRNPYLRKPERPDGPGI